MGVKFEVFKNVASVYEFMKRKKEASKMVTIYNSKGLYVFQGEVIFMNNSFATLCDDYNSKDTVLFADLVSGERMIG